MECNRYDVGNSLQKADLVYLVDRDSLKVHPFNENLYSDHEDAFLDLDVEKNGIRIPLIVNWKGQILDGKRRYSRANSKTRGLKANS